MDAYFIEFCLEEDDDTNAFNHMVLSMPPLECWTDEEDEAEGCAPHYDEDEDEYFIKSWLDSLDDDKN